MSGVPIEPSTYDYPARVSVVCPKCGNLSEFPVATKHDHTIEFVGVCGASAARSWCDAVIRVEVSAHRFPA